MTDAGARNPGIPFDPRLVAHAQINASAIARRAGGLGARRSLKQAWQAAWLVRALTCIDLTTLAGDDTPARVRRLCAKARYPLRPDLVAALGLPAPPRVAAVCVYPALVAPAVAALEGSGVAVASVATGFPAGQLPLDLRLAEIRRAVADGAREIDVVISRALVFAGAWQALYEEIAAMRAACGAAHLKVILATGELRSLRNVQRASWVAMMAGADFIKTSTGKEDVNATLAVGLAMARALRDYGELTGAAVGLKPAGGLRSARDALAWLILMKEELGERWMRPALFRLGASSMLADIERQLEHFVTGRYSAANRHALA